MDIGAMLFVAYLVAAMGVAVACAVIAGRRARARGRGWLPWALLGFLFGVLALGALWWLERRRGVDAASTHLNADSSEPTADR